MPLRMLREGILSSERVNRLGWEAEVFYRRLMSVVDDYGRFHAHPALLRAALYPLRLDSVADTRMASLLEEVEAAGLVRTYVVDGKRYVLMLDFRQQVRAKYSKYPPPPGEWKAPAQHVPGGDTASAHLGEGGVEGEFVCEDEGGGEVVFEDEGEGGGEDGGAHSPPRAAPPLHVQIAVKLREGGVNITSAHPHAMAWAARGLSVEQALEALAIARLRKPHGRIAPNYLAPIVEDVLQPAAPLQTRATAPPVWWASEAATLARGRELGLDARPGELMSAYRARLSAAIAESRAAPP